MKTYFFTIIALLFILSSCEKDLTYNGPDLVEWSPYNMKYSKYNKYDDGYFYRKIDDVNADSLQVSLVGYHKNKDLIVNFEILEKFYYLKSEGKIVESLPSDKLEEDTDYELYTTTAKVNDDYTLITGNSITIPANSSFGYLGIDPNNTSGEYKYLLIVLRDSKDLKVNENYKYFRLSISK